MQSLGLSDLSPTSQEVHGLQAELAALVMGFTPEQKETVGVSASIEEEAKGQIGDSKLTEKAGPAGVVVDSKDDLKHDELI